MTPKLNAIGLVVADMAAAVAFYRLLGLRFSGATEDHVECELGGGMRLMLDTEASVSSFLPDRVAPTGSPRASLAFELDSPAGVDALHAELVKAGHRSEREPWDAFWGQRYASLLDPDGNGVDLYAAQRPAS